MLRGVLSIALFLFQVGWFCVWDSPKRWIPWMLGAIGVSAVSCLGVSWFVSGLLVAIYALLSLGLIALWAVFDSVAGDQK